MIDFNAKLGHWPYRPVRGGLDALLEVLDTFGIEWAVVSSLDAVHYLNPQDGNEELADLVAAHADRLIPFAVLRPNFAGWAADLDRCLARYGMKGVVLYPNYHRFDLDSSELASLMDRAAAENFAVCVQVGLEDSRRQFDRAIVPEVSPEAVGAFARRYPRVSVVVLGLKYGQPERTGDPLPENLSFDLSNYEHLGELEAAVCRFGADTMLFGTNFPLFTPRANLEKIRCAALEPDERKAIVSGNARRLLKL